MSRTDLGAQAAVPVYSGSILVVSSIAPSAATRTRSSLCSGNLSSLAGTQAAQALLTCLRC